MVYSAQAIVVLAVAAFALGLMTSREHLRTLAVFIGDKFLEMTSTLAYLFMAICKWLVETVLSIILSLLMALATAAACVLGALTVTIVVLVTLTLVIFWILKQIWERIRPFLMALLAVLLGVLAAIWWLAFLVMGSGEVAHEVGSADWLMIGTMLLAVITLVALGLVIARWIGTILAAILLVALMLIAAIISGFIGVILGLVLLALILGLASLLAEGLGRAALLLGGIGILLIALLKGCTGGTPEVAMPKAQPTAEVPVVTEAALPREDWKVRAIIWARPEDGCIRITRRGGHPLNLAECIALTKEYKRQALWYDGLIIAPMVGRREVWYLLENRTSGELRWIPARHTVN